MGCKETLMPPGISRENTGRPTSMDDRNTEAMDKAWKLTSKLTHYHDGVAKEAARVVIDWNLLDNDNVPWLIESVARYGRIIPALKTLAATGSVGAAHLVGFLNSETVFKVKAGSNLKTKTITADRMVDRFIMEPISRGEDVSFLLPSDLSWPLEPEPDVVNFERPYKTFPESSKVKYGIVVWAEEAYENLLKRSRTPEADLKLMGFDNLARLAMVTDVIPNSLLGADTWNRLYDMTVSEWKDKGTDHLLRSVESLAETIHGYGSEDRDKASDTAFSFDDLTENEGLPLGFIMENIRARGVASRSEYLEAAFKAGSHVSEALYGRNHPEKRVGAIDRMFGESESVDDLRQYARAGRRDKTSKVTRELITRGDAVAKLLLSMPQSLCQLMNMKQSGEVSNRSFPTGFHLIRPLDKTTLILNSMYVRSAYDPRFRTRADYRRELAWAGELLGHGEDAAYRWMIWTVIQRLIEYMNPTKLAAAVPERQAKAWVLEGKAPTIMVKPLVQRKPARWKEGDGKSSQTVGLEEDMVGSFERHDRTEQVSVNIAGMLADLPLTWDGFLTAMRGEDVDKPYIMLRRILNRHVNCTAPVTPSDFPIPSEKSGLESNTPSKFNTINFIA